MNRGSSTKKDNRKTGSAKKGSMKKGSIESDGIKKGSIESDSTKNDSSRKNYSLIQNSGYVLSGVWSYNRLILFLIAANTLVTAFSPFIGILFPRQILEELLTQRRPERVAMLLGAFFLAAATAGYAAQYLKGVFMAQPARVITPCMDRMYQKCMDIGFQSTEDPDFLDHVQTATRGIMLRPIFYDLQLPWLIVADLPDIMT